MFLRPTRLVSTLSLAVALIGCSDGIPGPEPAYLEVTPLATNLEPGDKVQLTATVAGTPATVTWESSDQAVATVSATGLVTTIASGFTAVTATSSSGEKRSANINVITLSGTQILDGVPLTNLSSSGARGSGKLYRIFVPDGATKLTVTLAGGTGDADIYVRKGTPPTNSSFTYFSYNAGNDESIVVNNPARGTWYILVDLWDPYAGATLLANVDP